MRTRSGLPGWPGRPVDRAPRYFFSAVVIFLGNVLVLLLGVPLLAGSPVTVLTALNWWMQETGALFLWVARRA